jgi:DNA-directed RNA polymerase specialized sigma24 family protein
MSIQDPATHVRARQSAAFRYEAARRQLAQSMDERIRRKKGRRLQLETIPQQQMALDQATNLIVPLARYTRAEAQRWADLGVIEETLIDEEDMIAETILAAAERAGREGMPRAVFPWLRGIAREQVRQMVEAETERADVERSLDAPVKIGGEDWPDRAVLLRQVLADPNALLPDEIIEHRETWRLLEHAIARLPERWREIFLLRTVDAWDDDEIALAEDVTVEEIEFINLAARAFLRDLLLDSPLARGE